MRETTDQIVKRSARVTRDTQRAPGADHEFMPTIDGLGRYIGDYPGFVDGRWFADGDAGAIVAKARLWDRYVETLLRQSEVRASSILVSPGFVEPEPGRVDSMGLPDTGERGGPG